VGIDWHGDVAPLLANGFRSLGVEVTVQYLLRQRRRGIAARVGDELLHLPGVGRDIRQAQLRRASHGVTRAVDGAHADFVVTLAPELLARESVEAILRSGVGVWWFCDDPFDFERRGLNERPPVLDHLEDPSSVAYVAHPRWARDATADAGYLPYASACEPREGHVRPARGDRVVVVGSPRRERIALLSELSVALGERLEVWGWGQRARLGLTPAARPFRSRLRGAGPVGRSQVEELFRSAGVVLNLQDAQMVGAWNPQTFDLMSLAVPQVVWNEDPVSLFERPPPWEPDAPGIAKRAEEILADSDLASWRARSEEVAARHRWEHRAQAVLGDVASVTR
jgi:hypothetical protein